MATASCLRGLLRTSALRGASVLRRNVAAAAYRYKEALLTGPSSYVTILPNGVRVSSENSDLPTATVGLFVDSGSRHETPETNGVTHLFEQIVQKGTKSRNQSALAAEVEGLGARITSETGQEHFSLCFHSQKEHVGKAVEILSDMFRNPAISDEAFEAAQANTFQEQKDMDFDMDKVIRHHLYSMGFQGTSLALPTIGSEDSVRNITREDIKQLGDRLCRGPRIYLTAAGGVNHDMLVKFAEQHLGDIPHKMDDIPKLTPCRFTGSMMLARDDDMQFLHGGFAVETVGITHPDWIALQAASVILGSYDRSYGASPLDVYSKSAYDMHAYADKPQVFAFKHFNDVLSDTALWGVQFICKETSTNEAVHYTQKQWKRLANRVNEAEVTRAKNILKTQLYSSLDGPACVVNSTARQLIALGRRVPLQEMDERIDALNATWVQRAMSDHVYDHCPAVAGVGPTECFPEYNVIRSQMQWYHL